MTYKQIEQAREIRLWIWQIIVPAATTFGILMCVLKVRNSVKQTIEDLRRKIKIKTEK